MYLRKPTGAHCSVYATCLLECYCVKVSLTPFRGLQTRIRKDMIQSPRDQIMSIAQFGFPFQQVENLMNQESNTSFTSSVNTDITDTQNQLVWSHPIHNTLNPQIIRQLAFSNNLLHMAQSAKTPLGMNPSWEAGATQPVEGKQWFATLKMAVMARDNIEVDKLLKLKPQPADIFTIHSSHMKKNWKVKQMKKLTKENNVMDDEESTSRMNAKPLKGKEHS